MAAVTGAGAAQVLNTGQIQGQQPVAPGTITFGDTDFKPRTLTVPAGSAIHVTCRGSGKPSQLVEVVSLDGSEQRVAELLESSERRHWTLRLPPGRYRATSGIYSWMETIITVAEPEGPAAPVDAIALAKRSGGAAVVVDKKLLMPPLGGKHPPTSGRTLPDAQQRQRQQQQQQLHPDALKRTARADNEPAAAAPAECGAQNGQPPTELQPVGAAETAPQRAASSDLRTSVDIEALPEPAGMASPMAAASPAGAAAAAAAAAAAHDAAVAAVDDGDIVVQEYEDDFESESPQFLSSSAQAAPALLTTNAHRAAAATASAHDAATGGSAGSADAANSRPPATTGVRSTDTAVEQSGHDPGPGSTNQQQPIPPPLLEAVAPAAAGRHTRQPSVRRLAWSEVAEGVFSGVEFDSLQPPHEETAVAAIENGAAHGHSQTSPQQGRRGAGPMGDGAVLRAAADRPERPSAPMRLFDTARPATIGLAAPAARAAVACAPDEGISFPGLRRRTNAAAPAAAAAAATALASTFRKAAPASLQVPGPGLKETQDGSSSHDSWGSCEGGDAGLNSAWQGEYALLPSDEERLSPDGAADGDNRRHAASKVRLQPAQDDRAQPMQSRGAAWPPRTIGPIAPGPLRAGMQGAARDPPPSFLRPLAAGSSSTADAATAAMAAATAIDGHTRARGGPAVVGRADSSGSRAGQHAEDARKDATAGGIRGTGGFGGMEEGFAGGGRGHTRSISIGDGPPPGLLGSSWPGAGKLEPPSASHSAHRERCHRCRRHHLSRLNRSRCIAGSGAGAGRPGAHGRQRSEQQAAVERWLDSKPPSWVAQLLDLRSDPVGAEVVKALHSSPREASEYGQAGRQLLTHATGYSHWPPLQHQRELPPPPPMSGSSGSSNAAVGSVDSRALFAALAAASEGTYLGARLSTIRPQDCVVPPNLEAALAYLLELRIMDAYIEEQSVIAEQRQAALLADEARAGPAAGATAVGASATATGKAGKKAKKKKARKGSVAAAAAAAVASATAGGSEEEGPSDVEADVAQPAAKSGSELGQEANPAAGQSAVRDADASDARSIEMQDATQAGSATTAAVASDHTGSSEQRVPSKVDTGVDDIATAARSGAAATTTAQPTEQRGDAQEGAAAQGGQRSRASAADATATAATEAQPQAGPVADNGRDTATAGNGPVASAAATAGQVAPDKAADAAAITPPDAAAAVQDSVAVAAGERHQAEPYGRTRELAAGDGHGDGSNRMATHLKESLIDLGGRSGSLAVGGGQPRDSPAPRERLTAASERRTGPATAAAATGGGATAAHAQAARVGGTQQQDSRGSAPPAAMAALEGTPQDTGSPVAMLQPVQSQRPSSSGSNGSGSSGPYGRTVPVLRSVLTRTPPPEGKPATAAAPRPGSAQGNPAAGTASTHGGDEDMTKRQVNGRAGQAEATVAFAVATPSTTHSAPAGGVGGRPSNDVTRNGNRQSPVLPSGETVASQRGATAAIAPAVQLPRTSSAASSSAASPAPSTNRPTLSPTAGPSPRDRSHPSPRGPDRGRVYSDGRAHGSSSVPTLQPHPVGAAYVMPHAASSQEQQQQQQQHMMQLHMQAFQHQQQQHAGADAGATAMAMMTSPYIMGYGGPHPGMQPGMSFIPYPPMLQGQYVHGQFVANSPHLQPQFAHAPPPFDGSSQMHGPRAPAVAPPGAGPQPYFQMPHMMRGPHGGAEQGIDGAPDGGGGYFSPAAPGFGPWMHVNPQQQQQQMQWGMAGAAMALQQHAPAAGELQPPHHREPAHDAHDASSHATAGVVHPFAQPHGVMPWPQQQPHVPRPPPGHPPPSQSAATAVSGGGGSSGGVLQQQLHQHPGPGHHHNGHAGSATAAGAARGPPAPLRSPGRSGGASTAAAAIAQSVTAQAPRTPHPPTAPHPPATQPPLQYGPTAATSAPTSGPAHPRAAPPPTSDERQPPPPPQQQQQQPQQPQQPTQAQGQRGEAFVARRTPQPLAASNRDIRTAPSEAVAGPGQQPAAPAGPTPPSPARPALQPAHVAVTEAPAADLSKAAASSARPAIAASRAPTQAGGVAADVSQAYASPPPRTEQPRLAVSAPSVTASSSGSVVLRGPPPAFAVQAEDATAAGPRAARSTPTKRAPSQLTLQLQGAGHAADATAVSRDASVRAALPTSASSNSPVVDLRDGFGKSAPIARGPPAGGDAATGSSSSPAPLVAAVAAPAAASTAATVDFLSLLSCALAASAAQQGSTRAAVAGSGGGGSSKPDAVAAQRQRMHALFTDPIRQLYDSPQGQVELGQRWRAIMASPQDVTHYSPAVAAAASPAPSSVHARVEPGAAATAATDAAGVLAGATLLAALRSSAASPPVQSPTAEVVVADVESAAQPSAAALGRAPSAESFTKRHNSRPADSTRESVVDAAADGVGRRSSAESRPRGSSSSTAETAWLSHGSESASSDVRGRPGYLPRQRQSQPPLLQPQPRDRERDYSYPRRQQEGSLPGIGQQHGPPHDWRQPGGSHAAAPDRDTMGPQGATSRASHADQGGLNAHHPPPHDAEPESATASYNNWKPRGGGSFDSLSSRRGGGGGGYGYSGGPSYRGAYRGRGGYGEGRGGYGDVRGAYGGGYSRHL